MFKLNSVWISLGLPRRFHLFICSLNSILNTTFMIYHRCHYISIRILVTVLLSNLIITGDKEYCFPVNTTSIITIIPFLLLLIFTTNFWVFFYIFHMIYTDYPFYSRKIMSTYTRSDRRDSL